MVKGRKLRSVLADQGADHSLQNVICGLLDVCSQISTALQGTHVEAMGTQNTFGDEQLSVDILAEKLLTEYARNEKTIKAISSEEDTSLNELHTAGEFILCWDPLDGSSIVDCNWAVGTIVGIWRLHHHGLEWKGKDTLLHQTGRQQVGAIVVVYGPRTTALLAVNERKDVFLSSDGANTNKPGGATFDFRLVQNEFICTSKPTINATAKIFAPANLRASQDLPQYEKLIKYWMQKRYTLRYTGGLVPDIYQIFVKKQGVFCNPASKAAPAKLRVCYEVLPVALLIECAGGSTSDGTASLLSLRIEDMDQRTTFCCGSSEEVQRFQDMLAQPVTATSSQEDILLL